MCGFSRIDLVSVKKHFKTIIPWTTKLITYTLSSTIYLPNLAPNCVLSPFFKKLMRQTLLEWFFTFNFQWAACAQINTKNGRLLSLFVVHENVNQDDTRLVTYSTHRMHDSFLCVKCNDLMAVTDIIMDSKKSRLQSNGNWFWKKNNTKIFARKIL